MRDWSCVKIVKHLWKVLLCEGFRALWAKLDKSKKIGMFAITQPSLLNSTNPNLFFCDNLHTIMEDIFVKLQKIFLKNVCLSFLKN